MFRDLRTALRSLLLAPLFAGVALLTLALGIGANTAVFSVLKAVFLKELPFEQPRELVYVHVDNARLFPDQGYLALSAPYFRLLRERQQAFTELAVFSYPRGMTLRGQGEPEAVMGLGATGAFFPLLGVRAHLGRTLLPSDEGTRAVVLTHAFWRQRLGGDPALVGRTLNLETRDYTVVGVLPPRFRFQYDPDFFTSDGPTPQEQQVQWGAYIQNTLGRLKPGVDLDQARADLGRVHGSLVRDVPRLAEAPLRATPFRTFLYGDQKARGLLLGLTGGLVLLIACANLANLMAGRALQRQRETALRQALGGTRFDGLRPFLAEGLLIALGGALAGGGLALALQRLLLPLVPDELHAAMGLDLPLLLFTLATALGAGLLGALASAWLAARGNLVTGLKEGRSAGRPWLRNGLVTAQVALSLALLTAFGVLFQSLRKLDAAPLGFEPHRALVFSVSPDSRIHREGEGRAAYVRRVLEACREVSGVTHAAVAQRVPPDFMGKSACLLPDRPELRLTAYTVGQGPGAVAALGMTLLQGRDLAPEDLQDPPHRILVSRSLATRCWPGGDPLGKTLAWDRPGGHVPLTVVGMVEDVRFEGPRKDQDLEALYFPVDGGGLRTSHLILRIQGDPKAVLPGLRARLNALDPDLPLASLRPLKSRLDLRLEKDRHQARLLGVLAALALALAAAGIYGVMAHTVSQRTREIGIRKALGGQNRQVVWEITRRALALIALGLGTGALLALASGNLLKTLVYGVSAHDPLLLALATLVLGLVALLAALVPASRAARIQPAVALRSE